MGVRDMYRIRAREVSKALSCFRAKDDAAIDYLLAVTVPDRQMEIGGSALWPVREGHMQSRHADVAPTTRPSPHSCPGNTATPRNQQSATTTNVALRSLSCDGSATCANETQPCILSDNSPKSTRAQVAPGPTQPTTALTLPSRQIPTGRQTLPWPVRYQRSVCRPRELYYNQGGRQVVREKSIVKPRRHLKMHYHNDGPLAVDRSMWAIHEDEQSLDQGEQFNPWVFSWHAYKHAYARTPFAEHYMTTCHPHCKSERALPCVAGLPATPAPVVVVDVPKQKLEQEQELESHWWSMPRHILACAGILVGYSVLCAPFLIMSVVNEVSTLTACMRNRVACWVHRDEDTSTITSSSTAST